ncbi:hypothetical protein D3C76_1501250 [compost metagenome]
MPCRRRNGRTSFRASVSSSADKRTSVTLSTAFSLRLLKAALTEVLLISVASTLRTRVASGRVKLPLPQYNSSKSSGRSPRASYAQLSIFWFTVPLGWVNAPSGWR